MKWSQRFLRPMICLIMVVLLAAQCAPALAISGSTSLAKSGNKYVVNASGLNFRSGPGTNFSPMQILRRGTVVTYLSSTRGWWRVSTSSGRTGYVDRQFLTPQSTSKTGSYFVTASKLCIRKSPTTSSGIAGTVSKGTLVTISQLNGDWGYLSGGASARGWVALKYLSTSRPSSGSNSSSSVSNGMYTVTATALNVRKSGSNSAKRIDTIKRGTQVRVTQANGSWVRVTYNKSGKLKDGWVSALYLSAN